MSSTIFRYKNLLVELDERGQAKAGATWAFACTSCWKRFAAVKTSGSFAQARAIKERKYDAAEELAALQSLIDQERRRQGISVPTDG